MLEALKYELLIAGLSIIPIFLYFSKSLTLKVSTMVDEKSHSFSNPCFIAVYLYIIFNFSADKNWLAAGIVCFGFAMFFLQYAYMVSIMLQKK